MTSDTLHSKMYLPTNGMMWVAIIANCFSFLFSLVVLALILRENKIINVRMRRFVIVVVVFNILQQILSFYTYHLTLDTWYQNLLWLTEGVMVLFIAFLDLAMLGLFSSLDQRITSKRLWLAVYICTGLCVLLNGPMLYCFVADERLVRGFAKIANYASTVYLLLVIIVDNGIAGYLLYLVYTNLSKVRIAKALKSSVLKNASIMIMDWIAIIVFFYQLVTRLYTRPIQQLCVGLSGIHCACVYFIYLGLEKIVMQSSRRRQPVQAAEKKQFVTTIEASHLAPPNSQSSRMSEKS
ncbi:hypothetical protein EDD86DRAFT_259890 [Gorgonomyces haynaldii]|nr:hypothetical protein EDD86DRAFT_259890 [Gorgonomyces haynaldii]